MTKKIAMGITRDVREIFTNYYRILEQAIRESVTDKAVKSAKSNLDKAFNKFWQLPQFVHVSSREDYFKEVQEHLLREGFYLDMTPQHGAETGKLNLETVDNISLRAIISRADKKSKIGDHQINYIESILGDSLIQLPRFVEPIVEAASISEIVIFVNELFKTLENDYSLFKEYGGEAKRRFKRGVLSADNLFCVTTALYKKQWGTKQPGKKERNLLIDHFRLHGKQHILDFGLLNSGGIRFVLEDPSLSEALNKDMVLEARVMVRQLLEKSLPYYVLSQIISFKREWMEGSRSEYAWAGHLLFKGLLNGDVWTSGVEKLKREEIYQSAVRFANNNKNFAGMLG